VARAPLIVLDIGNTALKAVAFGPSGAPRRALRIPFGPRFRFPRWAASAEIAVVVSVSGARLALVERLLGRRLPLLGREVPVRFPNLTRRPRETGLDRICAAAGAALRRRRAPAVVVGLGTAVTVDVVDRRGRFLGGAIAPGLRAAARGLALAAPRLPAADAAPGPAAFPGRSTREALRAGLLLGFAGLVDRLVEEASRAAAGPGRRGAARVPVLVHGGDADAVVPLLRRRVVRAPWLVAEGARALRLQTMLRGGRRRP
jgi:type III pantothenate kinase